jgi:protein-tyrosine phosphatase
MTDDTQTTSGVIRVLMVCLGNICRSPMAEGVFRHHVKAAGLEAAIVVASAGTGRWHVGEPPHAGTRRELSRHGLSLGDKRAQHVAEHGPESFDYVVAMDRDNLRDLGGRGVLLLDFADPPVGTRDVPDPYYGGGFEEVYDLVDAGCRGLLAHIVEEQGLIG